MKRFVLLYIAMALALSVKAEYVSPDAAAGYAQIVLGMNKPPLIDNSSAQRALGRNNHTPDPGYYVFNNPDGGWAIISADDRVNPVIGYSESGSFNLSDMPDNLKQWLNDMEEAIDDVRSLNIEPTASVKNAWESPQLLLGSPGTKRKVLSTALWSQSSPYNDLCPIATGESKRSVAGCVATAMAIICQYNKWPEHGKGFIGDYTTDSRKTYIPGYSIDNHYYNWSLMDTTDASESGWTTEQKHEVAKLTYDCGVMARMDYTSTGSSAADVDMLNGFRNHLSYPYAVMIKRSSYTLSEWYSIICREIDEGRVTMYGGKNSTSGHAFVCDGYEIDGTGFKLHFNWGNGGNYNGFFYDIRDMIVTESLSFPNNHTAIIGLAPDNAQIAELEKPQLEWLLHDGFYGMTPSGQTDMTVGSSVSFELGHIYNNELSDFTAEFKVCLTDKLGTVRQEGWYSTVIVPARVFDPNKMIFTTSQTVLEVTPDITDRFVLYMKADDGTWNPINGNKEIFPDVDGIYCGVTPMPLIMIEGDCEVGKEVTLSLTPGYTIVKSVKWIVNGVTLDGNSVKLVAGKNDITAVLVLINGFRNILMRTLDLK